MAKYEIKIVTTADTAAAQKTAQELDKTTQATEKAEKGVSKLGQAFQKLAHEVPLAGVAVAALKNPFTLVTIAAGFAIAKFREFSESVDQMAERMRAFDRSNLTIRNFHTLIAEGAAERRKFADDLDLIAKKGRTVEEMMQGLGKREERKIAFEGRVAEAQTAGTKRRIQQLVEAGVLPQQAADAMTGVVEGQAKAAARARDERLIANQVNVTAQGMNRIRDEIREAQGALPGALSAEDAAKKRAEQVSHFQRTHLEELQKRQGDVAEQIKGLSEGPLDPLRPLLGPDTVRARAERRRGLELEQQTFPEQLQRLRAMTVEPGAAAEAATERRKRLEAVISGGQERLRALGIQRGEQDIELQDVRGLNRALNSIEGVPQFEQVSGQARFDARRAAMAQRAARQSITDIGGGLGELVLEMISALKRVNAEIAEAKNQLKRNETR